MTDAPMNTKSWAINTNALSVNTIYKLDRVEKTLVTPTYETDATQHDVASQGVALQNRTTGPMYIWYGVLPVALRVGTEFVKAAYKIDSGATYTPLTHQMGLMYMVFAAPSGGYIHHLLH